jgi:hypothetical protein
MGLELIMKPWLGLLSSQCWTWINKLLVLLTVCPTEEFHWWLCPLTRATWPRKTNLVPRWSGFGTSSNWALIQFSCNSLTWATLLGAHTRTTWTYHALASPNCTFGRPRELLYAKFLCNINQVKGKTLSLTSKQSAKLGGIPMVRISLAWISHLPWCSYTPKCSSTNYLLKKAISLLTPCRPPWRTRAGRRRLTWSLDQVTLVLKSDLYYFYY